MPFFWAPASKEVVDKPAGIRAYFEKALLNHRPRGAKVDSYAIRVASDAAIIAGKNGSAQVVMADVYPWTMEARARNVWRWVAKISQVSFILTVDLTQSDPDFFLITIKCFQ